MAVYRGGGIDDVGGIGDHHHDNSMRQNQLESIETLRVQGYEYGVEVTTLGYCILLQPS